MSEPTGDKAHERHAEICEWLGSAFDPEDFDPEPLKADVAALALSPDAYIARSAPSGLLNIAHGEAPNRPVIGLQAAWVGERRRGYPRG
jgi:hypothetical protein